MEISNTKSRRGPAQEPFGFGTIDYKREIARLEGWTDAEKETGIGRDEVEQITAWTAENGAKQTVLRRFIDSRFASTPHIENDRPVTLLENFANIGLYFDTTPGDEIEEGVQMINNLLRYNPDKPVDGLNCPQLYISDDCVNTIFALRTWRNAERGKGATKDPIDNLRYFALSGAEYISPDMFQSSGGGHY